MVFGTDAERPGTENTCVLAEARTARDNGVTEEDVAVRHKYSNMYHRHNVAIYADITTHQRDAMPARYML